MPQFERGFKTWAERTALGLRRELNISSTAPLDPGALAAYLDIELLTPEEIPGLPRECLQQLMRDDPWGWSATSLSVEDYSLIIYNPRHSKGRRASDIAHELAHFILDHHPATVIMSQDGRMVMRSYDQDQEDQANWLAWCMLLPRGALLQAVRRGLSPSEIAEMYGVTEDLVTFRTRICGVEKQVRSLGTVK